MKAQDLKFDDGTFDVILNRHAPIFYEEVVRVRRRAAVSESVFPMP